MRRAERPLWTCPDCGHRFVTANMWHSCSDYDLAHHFDDKEPHVRATFDAFLAAIETRGPVTVIPQKTRIAIQVRVRFAGAVARQRWLLASLWLAEHPSHPRLTRVESFGPRSFGATFRLNGPDDIDDALRELIAAAYAVGRQAHLTQ